MSKPFVTSGQKEDVLNKLCTIFDWGNFEFRRDRSEMTAFQIIISPREHPRVLDPARISEVRDYFERHAELSIQYNPVQKRQEIMLRFVVLGSQE